MNANITLIILIFFSAIIVYFTDEPENIKILKKKYVKFLKFLPKDLYNLQTRSIITGTTGRGDLGSNVNKGYEINICVDNDVNSMFHVLLHELAHCTVPEYEHSDQFWKNFNTLKSIAVANNFYTPLEGDIDYCGKKIRD